MNNKYNFFINEEQLKNDIKKITSKRIDSEIKKVNKAFEKSLEKISIYSIKEEIKKHKNDFIEKLLAEKEIIKSNSVDKIKVKKSIELKLEEIANNFEFLTKGLNEFKLNNDNGFYNQIVYNDNFYISYNYEHFIIIFYINEEIFAKLSLQLNCDNKEISFDLNKINLMIENKKLSHKLDFYINENKNTFINILSKINLENIISNAIFLNDFHDNNHLYNEMLSLMNIDFSYDKKFKDLKDLIIELESFIDKVSLKEDINIKIPEIVKVHKI